MAKQVIILEKRDSDRQFRIVYWLTVPASRQGFYANPSATSAYRDASAPEIADLVSGAVTERVEEISLEPGATIAQAQAAVEARWAVLQSEVTNVNPWNRYGTFWNGATWTPGGVG